MPRWIKNGGWIPMLAAIIFFSFCAFSAAYSNTHAANQTPRNSYLSPQNGRGNAGSMKVISLSLTPDIDIADAIPPPLPPTEQPDFVPDSSEDNGADSDTEIESVEIAMENQELIEETVDELGADTSDVPYPEPPLDEFGVAEFGDTPPELSLDTLEQNQAEMLSVLVEIRNALNIQLYIYTLIIAAIIIYFFILRPIYRYCVLK